MEEEEEEEEEEIVKQMSENPTARFAQAQTSYEYYESF